MHSALFATTTVPLDDLRHIKLVVPVVLLALFWCWETWRPYFGQPQHPVAVAVPPDAPQRPAHGRDHRDPLSPGRASRGGGAAAGPHSAPWLRGLEPRGVRHAAHRHYAVPPRRHFYRSVGSLA